MPYKNKECGIYVITTPSGSQYVGSSYFIRQRWSEHRMWLKRGLHHSERLQNAWNKYGSKLAFSILEECNRDDLNEREQYWIDLLKPVLNTTLFIENVWANPETRDKLHKIHNSAAWKEARREIGSRPRPGWRSVDCSDGSSYPSMALAATAFGIRTSGIARLCGTQGLGRLGVRFKFANDGWRPLQTLSQKHMAARRANGTLRHSAETIAKFKETRKGWKPSRHAWELSLEASRIPVIATCIKTGKVSRFPSQRAAARIVRPGQRQASATISRVCAGRRPSAFGYKWDFDYEQRKQYLAEKHKPAEVTL